MADSYDPLSMYYPSGLPSEAVLPEGAFAPAQAGPPQPSADEWAGMSLADRIKFRLAQGQAELPAATAGFLDAGGVTSDVLHHAGMHGPASWLDRTTATDPDSADAASGLNPLSWLKPLGEAGRAAYDLYAKPTAPAQPKIMTQEEYRATNLPAATSKADFVSKARNDYVSSKAYKAVLEDRGPKTADRAADRAASAAGQTWEDNQKQLPAQQAAIDARYGDYKANINKQMAGDSTKNFAARYPEVAKILQVGGPLASMALARFGLGKIAKTGQKYIDDAAASYEGNKAFGYANATANADKFANAWGGWKTPLKQAGTIAAAASIPGDLRNFGTVFDATTQPSTYVDADGNPQPNVSQREAAAHMGLWDMLKENAGGLPTGLVAAGIGGKTAKAAPLAEAATLADPKAQLAGIKTFATLKAAEAKATPKPKAAAPKPEAKPEPAKAEAAKPMTRTERQIRTAMAKAQARAEAAKDVSGKAKRDADAEMAKAVKSLTPYSAVVKNLKKTTNDNE